MIIIHRADKKIKYLLTRKEKLSHSLSFIREEIFENFILRLDRIKKKLTIAHVFNPFKMLFVIDLQRIKSVGFNRIFLNVRNAENNPLLASPDLIQLNIESFGAKNICLNLFEKKNQPVSEVFKLENKIRSWQRLLSRKL